jgi:spartin
MTDKVAAGVLGGIVYTTGLLSRAVVNSPVGKAFFKLLPGEVVLVSLDAFSKYLCFVCSFVFASS